MKKYTLGVLAMIIAVVGSAFTPKAMKATSNHKQAETTWYFTGSNINEADQASHWQTVNPELGCGQGATLPCEMGVENAADRTQLQSFLNGKSDVAIRDTYSDSQRD